MNREMESNVFNRNPKTSIIIFVLFVIFCTDIVAAKLYEHFYGQPWYLTLLQEEAQKFEEEIQRAERSYRIRSDIYHHDLRKNVSIDNVMLGAGRYRVSTDSLGFRSRYVKETPLISDKYTIVFIGDSFTEGFGVDYNNTFVGIIEDELSKENIEVLNAGVASYSPIFYWRKIKFLIEDVGLKFNELVVYIDIGDICGEAVCYTLTKDNNIIDLDEKQCVQGPSIDIHHDTDSKKNTRQDDNMIKGFIRNNTLLIYFVMNKIHDYLLNKQEDPLYQYEPEYAIHWGIGMWTLNDNIFQKCKLGLEKTEEYMQLLVDLLKKYKIKLTIAVYPWPYQIVNKDLNSLQVSFWEKFSKKNNIGFINYFPCFIDLNENNPYNTIDKFFIKKDIHWNAQGHHMIASAFLAYYKNSADKNFNYCSGRN